MPTWVADQLENAPMSLAVTDARMRSEAVGLRAEAVGLRAEAVGLRAEGGIISALGPGCARSRATR